MFWNRLRRAPCWSFAAAASSTTRSSRNTRSRSRCWRDQHQRRQHSWGCHCRYRLSHCVQHRLTQLIQNRSRSWRRSTKLKIQLGSHCLIVRRLRCHALGKTKRQRGVFSAQILVGLFKEVQVGLTWCPPLLFATAERTCSLEAEIRRPRVCFTQDLTN